MKNLLILLLLLVASFSVLAQGPKKINTQKALDYYKQTNLAELAICDSNFKAATEFYKQAFTVNPDKPFSRDLLNAFFAAMDTREYALAEKYIKVLLSRGIAKKFLDGKMLKYYDGEPLQQLQAMLNKYPNDTLKNSPLIKSIREMVRKDQAVRMYFSELRDGDYMTDSVYSVDYAHAQELHRLFKKHGVPNESVLGNGGHEFLPGSSPDYDILVLHHASEDPSGSRPGHFFDTMLFKAIYTLDYDARNFATSIGRGLNFDSIKYGGITLHFPYAVAAFFYKGKIYPDYWDDVSERQMNAERAKIGLETLDEIRKKLEAVNIGVEGNSVLAKYSMTGGMAYLIHASSEASLKRHLAENSKNGTKKTSLAQLKKNWGQRQDIGWGRTYWHVIGETSYDTMMAELRRGYPEWFQERVVYTNWKNRISPLKWGVTGELVRNEISNIDSDTGRYNQARFVPGYNILIHPGGWSPGAISFYNQELIFDNDKLISFTADADTAIYRYKIFKKRLGEPVVTIRHDTISCTTSGTGKPLERVLTTRTYTWEKANNRTEIVRSEYLNEKCIKRFSSVYSMTDIKRYTAYQEKIKARMVALEKEFVATKKPAK